MMHTHNKGFTLIELLVVVAIIGLLSSIVVASLNVARTKARDGKILSEMKNLQNALELHRVGTGTYPSPATANTITYVGTWPNASAPGASPSMSSTLAPLVTSGSMPNIPLPAGSTFYAYIGNATANVGSCGGASVSSNLVPYIVFFNTELPHPELKSGLITTPAQGVAISNLYCMTLQ